MEAKKLIERAKNSVVDQAYIKGCPNSPQEWFVSTEKLIPLQEMAIFKAGIKEAMEFMNRFYEGRLLSSSEVWQAKLKEWGVK